ncbi:MAG: peptide chain release factor 2 [Planctomycetes bacterium]|nr:peptide chain release factor 2 [Planctomycetota bacterium]
MEEARNRAQEVRQKLTELRRVFDYTRHSQRALEIQRAQERPGFWEDSERAKQQIGELNRAMAVVGPVDEVEKALADVEATLELMQEAGGDDFASELAEALARVDETIARVEFQVMLGGKHDARNAFLVIQAGAGGVDACDWAGILLRMYLRWIDERGFKAEKIDMMEESEGGIRSATIRVIGEYAYGWLKAEVGVHRLVRISPFDSQARRQTSFASVDVTPEFDDEIVVKIQEKDLRIDTYRSGGAGGQHVNVTDSAVRITHLPTGIVVACQNERSQHKNRATAMKMLQAKLYRFEEAKREAELAVLYGEKGEISWGNQIRSYVMHPYQLVKDHRTDYETGNIQGVLDGELLDGFMQAYLRSRKPST